MRAKEYRLLWQCVETGAERGWGRAYKHVDDPPPQDVREDIVTAIMQEIGDAFVFPSDTDEDG